MDDVIIDFVANTEGLKPVIQYLHQIGQITDEQVKDFEQMNKLYADRSKRIAEERTQLKGASRDMSDLAKSAQDVNKAIAGKAMEDATKKMVEYGKEVENVTKKYTSAKQELKELTKLITNNQLAGEQLKAAKERAAELTDQISDARGEIAAMASDTRKFDLLVEGIRGVTSAFSAVTSAQALFGQENEDVQKALLKVQAAMALATSTQEIMNIATTQGGIATKISSAAQAGYAAVVGTSTGAMKAFRIALAGTGIGLAVIGIALLVEHWETLNAKVRDFLGLEAEIKQRSSVDAIKEIGIIEKAFNKELDLRKAKGEDVKELELARTNDLLDILEKYAVQYKNNQDYMEFLYDKRHELQLKQAELEKQIEDERLKEFGEMQKREIAQMRETDALLEQSLFETTNHLKKFKDTYLKTGEELDEPLVPDNAVVENKENLQQMNYDVEVEYRKAKKLAEDRKAFQEQTISQVANFAFDATTAAFSSLYDSMNQLAEEQLNQDLYALEQRKEMELSNKNLTEQQKAAIEQKYRKQESELKKKAWKAEQEAKAEQAIINGFLAFTQSLATQGYPAGLITGALALATAGIQSALILSKPVPEFAKGTKGSEVTPPGFKLVGEEGPELIYEPGGAKVITAPDTAKILAAYQIPAVPDASGLKGALAIGPGMPAGIDYNKLGDVIAEKLRKNPQTMINIDKGGFSTHIISKSSSIELLNNDYTF